MQHTRFYTTSEAAPNSQLTTHNCGTDTPPLLTRRVMPW